VETVKGGFEVIGRNVFGGENQVKSVRRAIDPLNPRVIWCK
jgi:hypothetical protein